MECPNCSYVSVPGESPIDGTCPSCGHRPDSSNVPGTADNFHAYGMPAPGEDDGNQGNPLAEGVIMGADGERPPSSRDNYMGSVQPPLWFAASELPDDPVIPMDLVDVLEADDVPKKRKDRDLDSLRDTVAHRLATTREGNILGSALGFLGGKAGWALGGLAAAALAPETGGMSLIGPLLGGAAGSVMGHALGGRAENAALGTGQQPVQQQPVQDVQPPSYYGSLHNELIASGLDTNPTGNDSVPHDSEDGDSKEHDDGDRALSLQTDDAAGQGGVGTDQAHGFSEDNLGRLLLMMPLLLHHGEQGTGAMDPLVQALDQHLEAERPGYKDNADPHAHQQLIMILKGQGQPGDDGKAEDQVGNDSDNAMKSAAGPERNMNPTPMDFSPENDTAIMECPECRGRQCVDRQGRPIPCDLCGDFMGVPARGEGVEQHPVEPENTTFQPHNNFHLMQPNYGSIHNALQQPGLLQPPNTVMHPDEQMAANTMAQTPCPRCGTPTPLGQPCPNCTGRMAYRKHAEQGPQTDEQKAAVAQLLLDKGRAKEIPDMLQNPGNYAKELSEITGQQEPPPAPDPSQQPPAPPMMPPPADGGMQPGMSAPSPQMGMMSAINKWSDDHLQKHHDNMDNDLDVDAADLVHQEDPTKEQDTGHTWLDESGQPLRVGQEYEMFSNKYDIPDMVRIESVKPDSVEYTLTGEYGLEHRTEIGHEEAQLEGLSFSPVSTTHPDAPDGVDGELPSSGTSPGMEQSDSSTPHEMFSSHNENPSLAWLKEGGANFTPMEQREFIEEAGVARNADKLDLSGTHYESSRSQVEVDSDYFLFGL